MHAAQSLSLRSMTRLGLSLAAFLALGGLQSTLAQVPDNPAPSLSDMLADLNAQEVQRQASDKSAQAPSQVVVPSVSEVLAGDPGSPVSATSAQPSDSGSTRSLSEISAALAGETGAEPTSNHPQPAEAKGSHEGAKAHAESGEHQANSSHGEAKASAEHGKEAHGEKAAETHGHGEAAKAGEGGEEGDNLDTAQLISYAEKAFAKGRMDLALTAYKQLLSKKMSRAQQKQVLLGFARALKKKGDLTKAVAVYERIIKDYPIDNDTPDVYLELGRCQRALGAYATAITRFYSVINSTIKLPEDGAAKYRQLAKTAQFEIAETYFMQGDYQQASRFYGRLRLLDLADSDRARAHFMAAYSLMRGGDYQNAINQFLNYIELNPNDENIPEAHYQLALCHKKLGHTQDAMAEAVELLRVEKDKTAKDPKRWAYWQRKTGNQIANDFYEQGDFRNALTIYLTLSELSEDPAWRLPLAYQIGLCHERMGRTDKAIECYQSIIDTAASKKGDEAHKQDYADLSRMADWRLKQIKWLHGTEQKLNSLLPSEEPASPSPKATK